LLRLRQLLNGQAALLLGLLLCSPGLLHSSLLLDCPSRLQHCPSLLHRSRLLHSCRLLGATCSATCSRAGLLCLYRLRPCHCCLLCHSCSRCLLRYRSSQNCLLPGSSHCALLRRCRLLGRSARLLRCTCSCHRLLPCSCNCRLLYCCCDGLLYCTCHSLLHLCGSSGCSRRCGCCLCRRLCSSGTPGDSCLCLLLLLHHLRPCCLLCLCRDGGSSSLCGRGRAGGRGGLGGGRRLGELYCSRLASEPAGNRQRGSQAEEQSWLIAGWLVHNCLALHCSTASAV
jgi:hypothetical protein